MIIEVVDAGKRGPKIIIIATCLFPVRFSAVMLSQKQELRHSTQGGPPNALMPPVISFCSYAGTG
jgi:hypothetical protein